VECAVPFGTEVSRGRPAWAALGPRKSRRHQRRDQRLHPGVDEAGQDGQGVTPAPQCLSVELEEEPFQGRELGGAQLLPEAPGRGGKVSRATAEQVGQKLTLAVLGLLNHREEEALFRPEVVDEHAVAGAERRGQLPQGDVAYPVVGQVTERTLE
jgi:hypothetical protein